MYTKKEQKILIKLARNAIQSYLKDVEQEIKEDGLSENLKRKRSVFITLIINKNLRGCIGHIRPVQPLYKDVIQNAVGAAFHDPRFYPLSYDEFNKIKIEIYILTVPKKLNYKDKTDLLNKLKPGKDGVIVKKENYQATYLPQVWESIKKKEQFLGSLCMKAGLSRDEWEKGKLEVETYQVEKIEEN